MNETAAAARREKHVEMHDAIQKMDSITRYLDDLIGRIEGPVPETQNVAGECEKESIPCFMDVLNGAPDTIREKTESANKRIQRLMELLF